MKLRRTVGVCLASALVVGAIAATGPSASAEPSSEESKPACESAQTEPGSYEFIGSPGRDALAASEELSNYFSEHRDSWAGVHFCRDYSGLAVYIAYQDDASKKVIGDVSAHYPKVGIHVYKSRFSSLEFEAAEQAALDRDPSAVMSANSDPENGRVVVESSGVTSSRLGKQASVRVMSSVPRVARKVNGRVEVPIVYIRTGIEGKNAATRGNDAPPFSAGADIRAEGLMCSLGPRVRLGGKYMMLTAGHCPGGTHYTPAKRPVGNQYTTAYPGNANVYGDWKLIAGKSYSPNVYNAGNSSSLRHPGAGLYFGGLAVGRQLCSSGRTTGQICGYIVQGNFSRSKLDGVTAGHQIKLAKQEGRWNSHGCNGTRGGDSGGPMYYNNGSGKMVYVGLVRGYSWWKPGTQKRCTYYATQLSGVRAWKSSVGW